MGDDLSIRRYRQSESEVDAVRFAQENQVEVADWCGGLLTVIPHNNDDSHAELVIYIKTSGNNVLIHTGDYVVKDSLGIIYSYNSDLFHSMFELVNDGPH
jgi:hypothetical protein